MVRGFEHLKEKIDDQSMQALFKSTGMTLMSNVVVLLDHYTGLVLSKWRVQ